MWQYSVGPWKDFINLKKNFRDVLEENILELEDIE